jgi:hypothetical protein
MTGEIEEQACKTALFQGRVDTDGYADRMPISIASPCKGAGARKHFEESEL